MAKHGDDGKNVPKKIESNQMFWLSIAQSKCEVTLPAHRTNAHLPWKARINYVLSNTIQFAQDFQCQKGSMMNPEDKCSIW